MDAKTKGSINCGLIHHRSAMARQAKMYADRLWEGRWRRLGRSFELPVKTIVLLPVFDSGAISPFVRLFFALSAIVLFSTSLLADPGSLDSLPTPVQNTLKSLLQDPKAAVGGVEIYQLGVGLAYKVTITMDGRPCLEAHIESTGQLVRCDPIPQTATDHKAKDKDNGGSEDDQVSPSP